MSWQALEWAAKQRTARSADKLVLLGLADCHNESSALTWPSLAWIGEFSALDRKTIITAIDRLIGAGLVLDSGIRKGRTGQVKAYFLALNSAENTVPKTAPLQCGKPLKSSVFPRKESQKRDTEPVMEPKIEVSAKALTVAREKSASGYPAAFEEFWAAYPRHKAKGGALKAWLAARKRGVSAEHLHAMAVAYAPTAPPDPQFIPHAATWLNQSRYDDQPEETPSHDRTHDAAAIRHADQQRLRDAGPSNPRVLAFARMAGIIPPDDGTTVGVDGSDATGSPSNPREHLRLVGDALPGFKFN